MVIFSNIPKIRELLISVYTSPHSDFYRDKYEQILSEQEANNLDYENFATYINLLTDNEVVTLFTSLPSLSRADVQNTHPDKRLFIQKSEVSFVSYTSGTTDGSPLVLYWSPVENYFFEPSIGTDSRTPLILHPALNKNFGHTFIQQCRQAKTPVTPVFADFQNLVHSAILASKTFTDGIYTTPTLAGMLADHIDTYYDASRIRLLALFSENLTSIKRENLKKRYPNARIANLYASSEIGQILFFPCAQILDEESSEFHFLDEVIVALELAEDGELILTTNQNKAFPLVRYATGDYFELVEDHTCACGITTPLLRWSGRMDVDKIRVNGIEIKAENVEYALKDMHHITNDAYQVHFYSTQDDTLRMIVEVVELVDKPMTEFAKIEAIEQIQNALLHKWHLTSTATLKTAIEKGIVTTPEIKFVSELSLKTLKTRRLVNHIT